MKFITSNCEFSRGFHTPAAAALLCTVAAHDTRARVSFGVLCCLARARGLPGARQMVRSVLWWKKEKAQTERKARYHRGTCKNGGSLVCLPGVRTPQSAGDRHLYTVVRADLPVKGFPADWILASYRRKPGISDTHEGLWEGGRGKEEGGVYQLYEPVWAGFVTHFSHFPRHVLLVRKYGKI